MNKSCFLVFFLFSLFFIISCSIPNISENDEIIITNTNNELIINNRSNSDIYYFIVEQEIAATILWAPSLTGPNIQSGKYVVIKFSEIYAGENQTVKKGTTVIVYYWDGSLVPITNIKSIVVEL